MGPGFITSSSTPPAGALMSIVTGCYPISNLSRYTSSDILKGIGPPDYIHRDIS